MKLCGRLLTVRTVATWLIAVACAGGGGTRAVDATDYSSEEFFEKRIRPLLVESCSRCHNEQEESGGLRVVSRDELLLGGDSGPAIVPGQVEESLLLRAIRRDEEVSPMPPDAPLSPAAVADFTGWIAAGAPWPATLDAIESVRHWAFQPVKETPLPRVQNLQWVNSSIDAYILSRLEADGLRPAPPASRRTWLRRVTFDLIGMPPTRDEAIAFEQDDSADAFSKVVDRLLASPHYGERWGRHWLDVVRYADTAGENSDHPLPHAWRYRNWVIQALNEDKPYSEFIREQIAGDLLAAQNPDQEFAERIVATGFLAIARRFGHDIDKDMHLTYEDVIDTFGKTVLGLSLGCARCHDHKYDPVSARDYYGLYGIFASTRFPFPGCEPEQLPRDLSPLLSPTELSRQEAKSSQERMAVEDSLQQLLRDVSEQQPAIDAGVETSQRLAEGSLDRGGGVSFSVGGAKHPIQVEVQKGEVILLALGPRESHGADTTRLEFEIVAGDASGRRWNVGDLLSEQLSMNPAPDGECNPAVWYFLDLRDTPTLLADRVEAVSGQHQLKAWRSGDTPSVLINVSSEPVDVWTKLPPCSFFMHPGAEGPVGLAWVSPMDGSITINGELRDAHPEGGDGVEFRLSHLVSQDVVQHFTRLRWLADLRLRQQQLDASRTAIPLAYAVAEGEPCNARVHLRGEPTTLGEEVPRKVLDLFGGQPVGDANSSGRLELADWLTDSTNPLTARVMVNRIWQWHFGRGLVSTPNDFGLRGTYPTHPELLDHLAVEFIRQGWSIKSLHRQIVLSATYRQESTASQFPNLYAGFTRRRLSAEEIRDTLLSVSGELDRTEGRAHPFPPEDTWGFTQHTPFAAEYEVFQRSVYRMQKRNRRNRFFALFDGADPNASSPSRVVTTVPTQALYFLNDPFVHARATALARRLQAAAPDDEARIRLAYELLYTRLPQADEQVECLEFLRAYRQTFDLPLSEAGSDLAWEAFTRVLLASSELIHVD